MQTTQQTFLKLLHKKDEKELRIFLVNHKPYTIARLINHIEKNKVLAFTSLPPELQAKIVLLLSEKSKRAIIPTLSNAVLARFLHFTDEDDAVDVLVHIPPSRHENILSRLEVTKRKKIEQLAAYNPQTAGGLMDLNFIIIRPSTTLKEVVHKVQLYVRTEGKVPLVLATDHDSRIMGYVPYRDLILKPPSTTVETLTRFLPTIQSKTEQEKVLMFAQKHKEEVMGVTDEKERIIGIIHMHDLLRIAEHEATQDVYSFAGVNQEEDVSDSVNIKVRRRAWWLVVNLATAFLAASVVSLFQGTIEKVALLAVYMPIVAGEGGNAATQALAVVVRGLALGDIAWDKARKILWREAASGAINGLIIGVIASVVALLLNAPPLLGLALGSALIINLFIAGLFGAGIPLILKRLNIDPATASSIFVTTATDVFGFLAFLGLGTLLLT